MRRLVVGLAASLSFLIWTSDVDANWIIRSTGKQAHGRADFGRQIEFSDSTAPTLGDQESHYQLHDEITYDDVLCWGTIDDKITTHVTSSRIGISQVATYELQSYGRDANYLLYHHQLFVDFEITTGPQMVEIWQERFFDTQPSDSYSTRELQITNLETGQVVFSYGGSYDGYRYGDGDPSLTGVTLGIGLYAFQLISFEETPGGPGGSSFHPDYSAGIMVTNTAVPAPSSLVCLVGIGVIVGGMEWWKKFRRRAQSTAQL